MNKTSCTAECHKPALPTEASPPQGSLTSQLWFIHKIQLVLQGKVSYRVQSEVAAVLQGEVQVARLTANHNRKTGAQTYCMWKVK
ncbi:hypothetical protein GN956_G6274 [Arapaima gigas]